jgi:fatty acid desaturase
MRGRRVFRGRLVADGMWMTHLLWAAWTLGCLAPGVWFCRLAATAAGRAQASFGPLFVGVLLTGTALIMLLVWRIAAGAIVLRPDGLWLRPGFLLGRLVPYGDIRRLEDGTRLVYEREARGGPSLAALDLPQWVLSNDPFREVLSGLAPGMEVRGEDFARILALRRRVGNFLALWVTFLIPLSLFVVLPPLQARTPWLSPWLAGGLWVAVVVALLAWQGVSEKRLRDRQQTAARSADPRQA